MDYRKASGRGRWFLAIMLLLSIMIDAVFAQPSARHTLSTETLIPLTKYKKNMDYSRAYPGKTMTYQVIRMRSLLELWGVEKDQMVELIAKDNFSVFVPAHLFFQTGIKDSVAWLAIEPAIPWPTLENGTNSSAGPYKVIWTNPGYSHISDEYWAWSVTHIAIHKKYPKEKLISAPKTQNQAVLQGYQIYISHCASCHNIDQIGQASIGPDLGGRQNPLYYYPAKDQLAAFIRNPAAFRPGRMSGSSQEGLSDKELESLIDYFSFLNGFNQTV